MIWFGWLLWHINHCRLFNAKSSYTLILNIYNSVWLDFNGISTIIGYPLHTYILNMHYLFWLEFYVISTFHGYLLFNPLYTYIH